MYSLILREKFCFYSPQTEGMLPPESFKYFGNYYITNFHQKLTFTYFQKKLNFFLLVWFCCYDQNLTAGDLKSPKIRTKSEKLNAQLKQNI